MISIIVAVRNCSRTLQRCINSVNEQEYLDRELIIIDGASNDGTVNIIESNSAIITRWISEPDKGIADAWNKGVSLARGEWLFFLGGDDYLWDESVLQRMAPTLNMAFPSFKVVYGRVACVNADCVVQGVYGGAWELAKKQFLVDMSLPHQGIFHHKTLFDGLEGFDTKFRYAPDYEFLLRELPKGAALHVPDVIVSGMEIGGFSSTLSLAPDCYIEFAQAHTKHGFKARPWLWYWRYEKALLKAALSKFAGEDLVNLLLKNYRRFTGAGR